jgi:serralysin
LGGGDGDDRLDGYGGADYMIGGAGFDDYFVDNIGDVVDELSGNPNESDTVHFSISFDLTDSFEQVIGTVERLVLTGSANLNGTSTGGDETIFGNGGDNTIVAEGGSDYVDGRGGNDTLVGGDGDDTLVGGAGADVLNGGAGIDQTHYVQSPVGLVADLQVPSSNTGIATGDSYISIENLRGSSFGDVLRGNAAANTIDGDIGDDILYGRNGSDTLIGGEGKDGLDGGAGNDSLRGDNGFTFSLGNDILDGGAGNDSLQGDGGKDIFRFDTVLSATTNVDRIIDYSVTDDTIQLDNAVFAGLTSGALVAAAFFSGPAAHDLDDRSIYNPLTGVLSLDLDGNGAKAPIDFGTASTGLAMTYREFVVI